MCFLIYIKDLINRNLGYIKSPCFYSSYNHLNVTCNLYLVSANLVPEADGYGFSYNYLDEMAQSYCASRITEAAWTFAVRRDCNGVAPKCNDICKNAKNEILKKISNQRTQ